MNDLFSLAGKNILIAGSAQGIGYLLTAGLGKYGTQIIINDITAKRAEPAVEKFYQEGIQAAAAPFNVTHKYEIDAAAEHIEKDIGPIDVLMNNAGIQCRHSFTEFFEQEWNDVTAVNQTAVFLVSQAVTRHMAGRKAGRVINICSTQSELGRNTTTPHTALKGAVKMLTRGMCVELVRHNIQVNGIAPGYFKTEMIKALVEDEAFTAWLRKRTPATRWGDPQELIGAAVFLSSKVSDFVNGHLSFVDGGMLVAIQQPPPYVQRESVAFLALIRDKDYVINHCCGKRRVVPYPDDRL